MRQRHRGFSLLEVVAAIGVFALGIVVVIGLLGSLAGSVRRNDEAEAAVHLAAALRAELAHRVRIAGSFAPVLELFTPQSSAQATLPSTPVLFANRSGSRFASPDDPGWIDETEPFFEVALAPGRLPFGQEDDATAAILVYTARIRWPARGDAATQQSWHVSGSVRR